MQQIAPRIDQQGRPAPRPPQHQHQHQHQQHQHQQQHQQHQQHQHQHQHEQHPYQQSQSYPHPPGRFQEPVRTAHQLHHPYHHQQQAQAAATATVTAPGPAGQASAQGHASSDRSIQMLRDPMDTTTTHYSPAEVMHNNTNTSTSSPTEPHSSEHMSGQDATGLDNSTDGRKGYGKRELSTSKRAAQNRAAQRAFRQRKEGYIKKLEEQVREYALLAENYKNVQQENYQLRDYIIALQSRLLEIQSEVPPPPGGLDGLQPGAKQGLGPQQGPSQLQGAATLPRLSELGAVQSQPPPQPIQPQYDSKMTPAQAALQGPSILHSPTGPR